MLVSSRLIRISSEDLGNGNGDVGRILFIKGLQEADSGRYTCTAVYTSSQRLETSVNLTTIGLSLFPSLFSFTYFSIMFMIFSSLLIILVTDLNSWNHLGGCSGSAIGHLRTTVQGSLCCACQPPRYHRLAEERTSFLDQYVNPWFLNIIIPFRLVSSFFPLSYLCTIIIISLPTTIEIVNFQSSNAMVNIDQYFWAWQLGTMRVGRRLFLLLLQRSSLFSSCESGSKKSFICMWFGCDRKERKSLSTSFALCHVVLDVYRPSWIKTPPFLFPSRAVPLGRLIIPTKRRKRRCLICMLRLEAAIRPPPGRTQTSSGDVIYPRRSSPLRGFLLGNNFQFVCVGDAGEKERGTEERKRKRKRIKQLQRSCEWLGVRDSRCFPSFKRPANCKPTTTLMVSSSKQRRLEME